MESSMTAPRGAAPAPTPPAALANDSAPLQAWLTLLGLALRNLRRNAIKERDAALADRKRVGYF